MSTKLNSLSKAEFIVKMARNNFDCMSEYEYYYCRAYYLAKLLYYQEMFMAVSVPESVKYLLSNIMTKFIQSTSLFLFFLKILAEMTNNSYIKSNA